MPFKPGNEAWRQRTDVHKLVDKPGVFMLVHKDELQIDPEYQREAHSRRITRLAAEWSWISCSVLIVAIRPDGSHFVMDGQHRKLAADRRADITHLPCMLFEVDTVAEEARNFLRTNTDRRMPYSIEKFNAQLVAADPVAVQAKTLVDYTGRKIERASRPESFSCITALMRSLATYHDDTVRVWPLLCKLCEKRVFHERLLYGMVYLEHRMSAAHASLTDQYWHARILGVGYDGLMDAMHQAMAYYKANGNRVWGTGLAEAINRGLRKNKLPAKLSLHDGDDT